MNDERPDGQGEDPEAGGGQGEALGQAVVAARFVAGDEEEAADDQQPEQAAGQGEPSALTASRISL